MHDALTGLPNRMKFEHALEDAVRQGIRDDTLSAVFMLDLDGFKPVNDAMGHAVGDEVLIEVGRRLKLAMRGTDVVARLGGDEFAIVQYRLNSPGDADRTAERILHEIRQPFDIKGQSVAIGVSIGVSLCPQHGIDQDELLEDADLALYQAKRAGRNTFKAFTDSMHVDRQQKHTVRDELVATLGGNSLSLVYQPVVSSKTGALKGLEAFARWEHPARGQLVARDFLPQFEQSQLMSSFAEWGIRYVLQQGSVWMKMGLPLVPISVNMSARQFLNVDLAELCTALSRELAIGLEWVRIDLDAAALHADFQRTADKVAALAQLGVLTNIDHFGQGLVALNRLMDVKINQLKISGTHFEPAADPTRSDALMAIIASIGKVMHVPIVATQIETPAMEARALSLGADLLQGNHISPALSCDDTEQWLRDRINR